MKSNLIGNILMFANMVCSFFEWYSICWLSVCIYSFSSGLDFCFANVICGTHGRCENTLTGFKCSCSLLFGGLFCDKCTSNRSKLSWIIRNDFILVSQKGFDIIVAGIIIGLLALCYILISCKENLTSSRQRESLK